MLKVGITGGIGSGKTTVCRVFELLGIPVFYADAVAKEVMHSDAILRAEVLKAFGNESYFPDGNLNRKHISDIVFQDEEELEKLNALVHPAVFRAFDQWALVQKAPYLIKEAALLFESESYKMCDVSVLVKSEDRLRIARVSKRDAISEEQVLLRMSRQLTDEEKEKLADYILYNDEKCLLIPQILHLHQTFLGMS